MAAGNNFIILLL